MRIVPCPGYRNPLDQMFRDESAAVTKRAQKSYRSTPQLSCNRSSTSKLPSSVLRCAGLFTEAPNAAASMLMCALRPNPAPPIEDVALAHFMSSYIPGSHFVYLPDLYNRARGETALPATVHAASLARLAWEMGQPALVDQARRSYAKALAETNEALSNPATATSDAVLVSVLLLSLYETIVWSNAGTPDNWTTHTRGAMALVRLRGEHQLNTLVGRQLFTQVVNIICVDSLRSRTKLPQDLLDLQTAALLYEDECPRFRMSSSAGELASLLADVAGECMTAEAVVRATQAMDAKFVAFLSKLPDMWQYEEEQLEQFHPDVYGRTIHRYSSNRAAQFWNSYRMTRIFLNGVMHGHARRLQPIATSILAKAESNVQQMAADICASVPQFTGPQLFSVASAATLLWPLSSVRGADLIRQDLRDYAEGRLKFLGRKLCIPQAEHVASRGEKDPLQDGLHMFYLS